MLPSTNTRASRPAIGGKPLMRAARRTDARATTPVCRATRTTSSRAKVKGPPERALHQQGNGALPAPAAPTATTAATRTEATATARTTTTTTRTATTGAARAILRFIDAQLTASHGEAIQGLDGLGGLGLWHLDTAKAARTTGLTIGRQCDGLDRAVLGEQVANLCFSRRERQVSNIDLHDSSSHFSLTRGRVPPSQGWAAAAIHYTAGNTVGIVWRACSWLGRIFEQRVLSPDRWRSSMHRSAFKRLKMQGERVAIGAENNTVGPIGTISAGFRPRT